MTYALNFSDCLTYLARAHADVSVLHLLTIDKSSDVLTVNCIAYHLKLVSDEFE